MAPISITRRAAPGMYWPEYALRLFQESGTELGGQSVEIASTRAGRSARAGTHSGPRYSSTECSSARSMLQEPVWGPAPMTSGLALVPVGVRVRPPGARFVRVFGQLEYIHAVSGGERRPHSWTSAHRSQHPDNPGFGIAAHTTVFHRTSATPPHRKTSGITRKRASSSSGPRRAGSSSETDNLRDRPRRVAHRSRVGATCRPAAPERLGGTRRWTGTRPRGVLRVYRRRRLQRAISYFRIGGTVSDRVLIGVEVVSLLDRAFGFSRGDTTTTAETGTATVVVLWFPSRPWFFLQRRRRPGVGQIHVPGTAGAVPATPRNRLTFGFGWDFAISRKFAITSNLAAHVTAVGDVVLPGRRIDDVIATMYQGSVGFTFGKSSSAQHLVAVARV